MAFPPEVELALLLLELPVLVDATIGVVLVFDKELAGTPLIRLASLGVGVVVQYHVLPAKAHACPSLALP